jgi:hypothetical protein
MASSNRLAMGHRHEVQWGFGMELVQRDPLVICKFAKNHNNHRNY